MAVYQVPQQLKDLWDTSKQSLIDILASATMQPYPEDRLSMFTPAQALGNVASQAQQGIPQGLADLLMQGSPEQAMSEGISGLVGPMLTWGNFKKRFNKKTHENVMGTAENYLDNMRIYNRGKDDPEWGSANHFKWQADRYLESMKNRLVERTKILSALSDIEKKLPEIKGLTRPVKKVLEYGSSNFHWNGEVLGQYDPDFQTLVMQLANLRDKPIEKINNTLLHELTHAQQLTKPYTKKLSIIKNQPLNDIFEPVYNSKEAVDWIKNQNYMNNIGYMADPYEMQARGVADTLTAKLYPDKYVAKRTWPETYDKSMFDAIDYLLSLGK